MARTRSMRNAFTLIELLVVIAIIAILAAILFPVFAKVREKAHQTACASNLKQISIAFLAYNQDFDETFPFSDYGSGATQEYWQQMVDPYIAGGVGLASKGQNKSVYTCPDFVSATPDGTFLKNGTPAGTPYSQSRPLTTYNVNGYVCPEAGKNYPPAALGDIDAAANVVLISESLGVNDFQYGRDDTYANVKVSATSTAFSNAVYINARVRHNGGSNFAFTDGHVKWFIMPGPTPADIASGATSVTNTARATNVAWVHCTQGQNTNPVGWFWPLKGVYNPVTNTPATNVAGDNGFNQVSQATACP